MIDVTTLPPEQIKRLQTPAQGSPCGCEDCKRERARARRLDDAENTLAARVLANDIAVDVAVRQLLPIVAPAPVADTRDDRTGEDDEPFQSDFTVQNY